MTDIIERAEAAYMDPEWEFDFSLVGELIVNLKAARAEQEDLNATWSRLVAEKHVQLEAARAENEQLQAKLRELYSHDGSVDIYGD